MLIGLLAKLARKVAGVLERWHTRGFGAVWESLRERVWRTLPRTPTEWLNTYRPTAKLLKQFAETPWPADAPTISVLVPVFDTRADWLRTAVESVLAQTYPRWQLVLVNDGSPALHIRPLVDELAARDNRIIVVHLEPNRGVSAASNAGLAAATGEYILFLDHDDALEPHCLHRFAEAILSEKRPGLLYADEALTGPDLSDVLTVRLRPAFSHDFYLCHPYFVHPVAIRRDVLEAVGGFDETLTTSHDVDLVLRVLAICDRVTHIPDVLYRWRTHPTSHGHASRTAASENTRGAVARQLAPVSSASRGRELPVSSCSTGGSRPPLAEIHPVAFNVLDIRFPVAPGVRVAILIPTKNQVRLLRECVESVERTSPRELADIVVIDHASDDPETLAYLAELRQRHRVVTATGPFNFSAICNAGVAQVRGPYSHYLFLNNDTAAPEPGWLEHMLGFACRSDVGIVGSTLLFPDGTIQHSGIVVGLLGGADNAFRGRPFARNFYEREPGENCDLICTRDFSAVTAACLLVRADVFDAVGGFDEELAVGFNDVDFCLRVRAKGWKVLRDAHAVLFHYESQSRGQTDRHPADTKRFMDRYADLIRGGDPYTSPLLDPDPRMNVPLPRLKCPVAVPLRTVTLR